MKKLLFVFLKASLIGLLTGMITTFICNKLGVDSFPMTSITIGLSVGLYIPFELRKKSSNK